MTRKAPWNPTAAFVAVYTVLVVVSGLVLLGLLFIGTDAAFRGSRSVEIPYLVVIRGDADPPYWDFHLYGILASVTVVPLVVAVVIVAAIGLVRARKKD